MVKTYKNPGRIKYKAIIQKGSHENSWTYVEFPYDLKEIFGVGNLVPVTVTFDGGVHYRGSLAKMGGPKANIILRKDVRAKLGKELGEEVELVVELDDMPRVLVVPTDVKHALQTAGLLELFDKLAYSHRKEYVEWIESAKKLDTRLNRIQKMFEMLRVKG